MRFFMIFQHCTESNELKRSRQQNTGYWSILAFFVSQLMGLNCVFPSKAMRSISPFLCCFLPSAHNTDAESGVRIVAFGRELMIFFPCDHYKRRPIYLCCLKSSLIKASWKTQRLSMEVANHLSVNSVAWKKVNKSPRICPSGSCSLLVCRLLKLSI